MKKVYFLSKGSQFFYSKIENDYFSKVWHTSTYHYPWLNTPENIISRYQWDEGEMVLTDRNIIIYLKTKVYKIATPKKATVGHTRLYAPMLAGGIFGPFAALAGSKGIIELWTSLIITLLALGLFYYGYRGVYTVEIQSDKITKKFFIDEVTPELESFLALCRMRE